MLWMSAGPEYDSELPRPAKFPFIAGRPGTRRRHQATAVGKTRRRAGTWNSGRNGEASVSTGKEPADLDHLLTQRILQRTGGRISQLSVETRDGQIVVQGHARSRFARQLALAAVQEVVNICNPPGCSVEFDIDVGQVYWRSDRSYERAYEISGVAPILLLFRTVSNLQVAMRRQEPPCPTYISHVSNNHAMPSRSVSFFTCPP